MSDLSEAVFTSAIERGNRDLLMVTWYISNVFTSKQASLSERLAAKKALLSEGAIISMLQTTSLSLWEIACYTIAYHLNGPPSPNTPLQIFTSALPDPSICSVTHYSVEGYDFVGVSLLGIPNLPITGYVPIQGDATTVMGKVPWIIELSSTQESNEPEYQVDLIFRVDEHPDSNGLVRVYH